jgi:HEAT repeats
MRIVICKLNSIAHLIACVGVCAAARADVIDLTNGGRVEGKIVQSENADKATFVVDLTGGGRLTIPRTQVARIDLTSDAEAEYQKLARSSPDTVDEHWKLAEWCRQHKLQNEYQRHLERILELDPNHAEARAALGFRQKDGQWMNRDDVMAARGLVLYDGRYVTPQHVELMQQQKETKATQADWKNRIEQLRRSLTGRRQDKAAEAHAEILAINDPDAAEAVVAVLRRERDPDLKRLWIEVTSHLNHRAAIDALVDLSLNDPDEETRRECLEYLIKSGRPGLSTPYIRALGNKDNEIVNRAAVALGQIRDHDSIGPLIDALITKHRVKVSDANPDQHAYTFSKDSNAFSFGGGGPQVVTQAVRNRAVLDALTTMSGGVSFEYDQEQWRGWLAAQAKATAIDIRRDQ